MRERQRSGREVSCVQKSLVQARSECIRLASRGLRSLREPVFADRRRA